MRINVSFTVDIDVDRWSDEYSVPRADVPVDVRGHCEYVARLVLADMGMLPEPVVCTCGSRWPHSAVVDDSGAVVHTWEGWGLCSPARPCNLGDRHQPDRRDKEQQMITLLKAPNGPRRFFNLHEVTPSMPGAIMRTTVHPRAVTVELVPTMSGGLAPMIHVVGREVVSVIDEATGRESDRWVSGHDHFYPMGWDFSVDGDGSIAAAREWYSQL